MFVGVGRLINIYHVNVELGDWASEKNIWTVFLYA